MNITLVDYASNSNINISIPTNLEIKNIDLLTKTIYVQNTILNFQASIFSQSKIYCNDTSIEPILLQTT